MRVQINLSEELVEKLDEYAGAVGLSRSGLCAYFIGQGMFGIIKAQEAAVDILKESAKQMQDTADKRTGL